MSVIKNVVDEAQKPKASRASFGEELKVLGATDPRIVALDADLSKSTQTYLFGEAFPKRFFNLGIAEANMIGVAAGLANAGFVPFAASFGCFLTGRFDQIRMSVSFTGANVRLVGTHSGVAIGEDGHSQMALEDLGLMRSLPNMTVFQPSDDQDTREFIRWSLKHNGPCYLRLTRQNLLPLRRAKDAPAFAPGRWTVLDRKTGPKGVVILASGGTLEPAIHAAEALAAAGQPFTLVNANWVKPIDETFLREVCASDAHLVVTVEDHYTATGLGGAVAEFLSAADKSVPLLRLGVERFGQSGSPQDNMKEYGFTGPAIAARISERLKG